MDKNLNIASAEFESLARVVLSTGGTLKFCARGSSMRPWIRSGDKLEAYPVSPGAIRRGDVLLGSIHGRLVVHRVIKIRKPKDGGLEFLLRGDALAAADGWIKADQVLGKVSAVHRSILVGSIRKGADCFLLWWWLLPGMRFAYRLASRIVRRL